MKTYIFGPTDTEVRSGVAPRLVRAGAPVAVYRDSAGTQPVTTTTPDGQLTVLVINNRSQIPAFGTVTDDMDTVWVSVQGGPLTELNAGSEVVESLAYSETKDFYANADLEVREGTLALPIFGGVHEVSGCAALLTTVPVGADVLIDIKKNGTSIFATPADMLRIAAGYSRGVHGDFVQGLLLEDGDSITVDIVQVGSVVPGADLVVSIRLQRR